MASQRQPLAASMVPRKEAPSKELAKKVSKNILSSRTDIPDWSPSDKRIPLFALYDKYVNKGIELQHWYMRRKGMKKSLAITLRLATIFFTLFGLIYPAVLMTNVNFFSSKQTLGYFAIAVAAACVLADKMLCISSSWRRYVTTAMEVEQIVCSFQLKWERLRASANDRFDEPKIVTEALRLIDEFQSAYERIAVDETKQFFLEFDSSRALIESVVSDNRKSIEKPREGS